MLTLKNDVSIQIILRSKSKLLFSYILVTTNDRFNIKVRIIPQESVSVSDSIKLGLKSSCTHFLL